MTSMAAARALRTRQDGACFTLGDGTKHNAAGIWRTSRGDHG